MHECHGSESQRGSDQCVKRIASDSAPSFNNGRPEIPQPVAIHTPISTIHHACNTIAHDSLNKYPYLTVHHAYKYRTRNVNKYRYVAVLKSEIDFDDEESTLVLDDEGNKTLVEGLVWKV
jgi:hypothetical protein